MREQNKSCRLKVKELGSSLVEFGLVVTLVALIAIPAIKTTGTNTQCKLLQAGYEMGSQTWNEIVGFDGYSNGGIVPEEIMACVDIECANWLGCINGFCECQAD